jgi:hypothetical protein
MRDDGYYQDDRYDDYDGRWRMPGSLPHSGPGVASFIISILTVIGAILAVIVIASVGRKVKPEEPLAILNGLLILGNMFLNLIGVVLGIVGTVQANRNKVFAIIGLCLNGVMLLGCGMIMCIGLAVMPH